MRVKKRFDNEAPHQIPSDAPPIWYQDRVLLAIMALALIFGLVYNAVILLGYGPDEPRHMNYVKLLFNEHTLPYIEPSGREHAGAHTLHPPLYYLILLPFYAVLHFLPEAATWHSLRVISLLLCLAALPLIYQIAWQAGGGDRNVARLTVAQVVLLPIFGMIEGVINNDSLTIFVTAGLVWLLAVKYPRDHTLRSAAIIGICCGLGGLSKATVVLCAVVAVAAYLFHQYGRGFILDRRFWLRAGVIAGLVLLLAGPWYVRNELLYGQFTPIEHGYTFGKLPPPESGVLVMMMHDNFPDAVEQAVTNIFFTTWVQRDWVPYGCRQALFRLLIAYTAIAVFGTILWWRTQRRRQADDVAAAHVESGIAVDTSYSVYLVTALACLTIALFVHWGWSQGGRYLLPALFGLSLFLARGWRGLIGSRRLPYLLGAWCAFALVLNITAVYWLLVVLNPRVAGGPPGF
jgi:4-amino-4-deoxy-L-arabinose transferase-like glycosyltransferase